MKRFFQLPPKKNPRQKDGAEILDPRPVAVPVGFKTSETMDQRIKRIIEHSLSVRARDTGLESFEEADDFDIDDDPVDPSTPWEDDFDVAAVQAADRGIVEKPKVEASRLQELKDKYMSPKLKKADAVQKPHDPPIEPKAE